MKLKKISAKDKPSFDKFLGLSRHELSVYAFENIYIWKGLFDIHWAVIDDSLCVFFKDKLSCFLYLPPLAEGKSLDAVKESFREMDIFNKNNEASRIENIEEADKPFYDNLGYECRNKSYDYVCKRNDLAKLAGDKFKPKRACFNYFMKHYQFQYLPFSLAHRAGCMKLYDSWATERRAKNSDHIYQAMLEDSRVSLKNALGNYPKLGLTGRVVKINGEIKAFTFGFKLNADTFCVLYEITDLSIKGLSQFIFRRLCGEMDGFKFINIMDDSGLDNLKNVKLSYNPVKLIPAYIATRKNA
jgi:uncharacterized protein